MRATMVFGVLAAVLAAGPVWAQTASYTYGDLVMRMVDPRVPAVLPADGEFCKQWSSWDRASRYDEATGKYVNWDANGDGGGIIREENGLQVMAEMEGPGCIWRIWSALPQDGRVKIYLDGSDEPVVDLPFKQYFSGDTAPFNFPELSYALEKFGCRGQNLYLPIPYQKSCKVVAEKGWGAYYQFVYRTYPTGTTVPTFSPALVAQHAELLGKVHRFFEEKMGELPPVYAGKELEANGGRLVLAPGERQSLELSGPRAIVAIKGKVSTSEDREDQMAAMRRVTLNITWDGQAKPAVWCPVGDFFGTAPGINYYKGFLTGMTEEGGYAYWYMPFARSAKIEVCNEDDKARTIDYEIVSMPLESFENLGYFHCKWHRDTFEVPADRWPDWSLLRTGGRGRFLGVMLHVWNPVGGWWGEGDEKFFVDGEKYPSTFGTGSEDYFGYAWCDPHLFQRPYHGQTMTENNKGHQSVYRWHLVDNIPFHTAFDGYIEKYFKTEEKGTEYAVTVCWYLDGEGEDPYAPVPVEQRHGYYVKRPVTAGGFRVLNEPMGNVQTQDLRHFGAGKWSRGDHLWWTDARPGQVLEVAFNADRGGKHKVGVILTKARDYGIVQLYVNGQKAGDPIDLYNPEVIRTDVIPLGVFDLKEGENTLKVEIVGANEAAVKAYMFGLDEVVLEPAD